MVATLAGLIIGAWFLFVLLAGTTVLAAALLGRLGRARGGRRRPQQAAGRGRTRKARRLAAEWPLLAQTLRLGYQDQWTRQHRFPTAGLVVDEPGVTASVGRHA